MELEPRLRKRGITSIALFGSALRGTATPESDKDLLVEIDTEICGGLLEYGDICVSLTKYLGNMVDMVDRKCISQSIGERVLAEAKRIF